MPETGSQSLVDMNDESDFIDPELVLQQLLEDPSLAQHITRTEIDGCETVACYLRVMFEPGQQRQILHVPFAPALKFVPQVEANATDQPDVRVRITDRQKFGIRAEVILSRQTETQRRLIVEVIATASSQP